MGFFGKTKKLKGLLAFGFAADGVCTSRITRVTGSKPVVEQASFFAVKQPLTPEALEKIARGGAAPRANAATGKRRVYFEQGGWLQTPTYRRDALAIERGFEVLLVPQVHAGVSIWRQNRRKTGDV